jgi:hypothetical protein
MTFQRTMQDIRIGTPVYSRDGDELGTVKEVRTTAFKVDAPAKPDYWLPTECLSTASTAGRLVVEADTDRLGDLKMAKPATR